MYFLSKGFANQDPPPQSMSQMAREKRSGTVLLGEKNDSQVLFTDDRKAVVKFVKYASPQVRKSASLLQMSTGNEACLYCAQE